MAENKDLISPLRRSRIRLLSWIELLPEDSRMDAKICVNELCDEAEREIERSYWDGFKQHHMQTQMPKT